MTRKDGEVREMIIGDTKQLPIPSPLSKPNRQTKSLSDYSK
jgi:hypothetical protein